MATQSKRPKMEHDGATVQSLKWDHPVQLVGEKVNDPDLLNCCMRCCLPILIYGRMIPCKHVLCLDCARKHSSSECSKCGEKVTRIEQNPLGTVFVCSFGSTRHGPGGCKRTYLSYRDMEAHVKHRHKKKEAVAPSAVQVLPGNPAQMITLSQPPPNLNQPPLHPYMQPPTHLPPHMVAGRIPTTNVPPPGLSVTLQQGHVQTIQSSSINMPPNLASMQPNLGGPMQTMAMQQPPQNSHPQRHQIPSNSLPAHHNMMPNHGMQMHGGPRPLRHVRPQPSHNPPAVTSKSHGNLISIPIQGSQNWSGQDGQQWSSQSNSQQHRQGQYNN